MRVFLCPFSLVLFPRLPYNVGMKDKELKIKVDDEFLEKVDYIERINGYKNKSDTVRKTIEKEYRKETDAYSGVTTAEAIKGCDEILRMIEREYRKEKDK